MTDFKIKPEIRSHSSCLLKIASIIFLIGAFNDTGFTIGVPLQNFTPLSVTHILTIEGPAYQKIFGAEIAGKLTPVFLFEDRYLSVRTNLSQAFLDSKNYNNILAAEYLPYKLVTNTGKSAIYRLDYQLVEFLNPYHPFEWKISWKTGLAVIGKPGTAENYEDPDMTTNISQGGEMIYIPGGWYINQSGVKGQIVDGTFIKSVTCGVIESIIVSNKVIGFNNYTVQP